VTPNDILGDPLAHRYLDLLKKSLLNELYIENESRIIQVWTHLLNNAGSFSYEDIYSVDRAVLDFLLKAKSDGSSLMLSKSNPDGTRTPVPAMRNYTELSHTMIGMKRLDNIQRCMETVLRDDIPGDFIETGVWRGGATIFMRGVLAAYDVLDRSVWVADSFEGVPPPTHPEDAGFDLSRREFPVLAVSRRQVAELFERYDLLDRQVKFLEGWFKDTLAAAPINRLAILRLDGDLYESTMDALNPLYDKVERGGFIIVDDYGSCPPCARAINDFRAARGIAEAMVDIDDQSIYWRKSS
jgi:O-methyltransferase